MNIKRLCLIAGLTGLPIAFANGAQVTINVPVELTNVPAGIIHLSVNCMAGVGAPPAGRGIWTPESQRGSGRASFTIPSSRNYRGTARVAINADDDATHYKCYFMGQEPEPELKGDQAGVSGPIPVNVPLRR